MSGSLSFIDHLRELRKRLFISALSVFLGAIAGYYFYATCLDLLFIPFRGVDSAIISDTLFMTSLVEGFFTKIRFSFLSGLILSSPVLIYQVLRFILPALEKKEKVLISIAVFMGTLLAALGFYLCYFHLLPFSIRFLTSSEFVPDKVGLMLNFGSNIFYVFNMLLYSLIVFQTPILLETMLYMNLVSRKKLLGLSRYVIVFIFIASAVITPPDIITQLGIALPLIILYFLTIAIAWVFKWGSDV